MASARSTRGRRWPSPSAQHGIEGLAALQLAARIEPHQLVAALAQLQTHVAHGGVGEADHGVDVGAQVEAGLVLVRLLRHATDIEEGAEDVASVVGGALGGHLPHVVGPQLAARVEGADHVEGELRKAELLQLVVGPDAHPALDGDVVADQLDVVQLGRMLAGALDHVELEDAGPSLRLAPGDAVQKQLGIDEVGAHLDAAARCCALCDTSTSRPTSPCTRSLSSRPSWVRSLLSRLARMRSGGCLSGVAPNTCCQLALASTPWMSISPLASTAVPVRSTAMLAPVTSCGADGLLEPAFGDARLALDLDVARLRHLAQRQRHGELRVDLAVDAGQRGAVALQGVNGLLVDHVERQRQRPLHLEGEVARARQRLGSCRP